MMENLERQAQLALLERIARAVEHLRTVAWIALGLSILGGLLTTIGGTR